MTTIPELQAKMAKLPTNLDRLDGFVNGPATGAGSTTVTDGGVVPSLMKLVAEFGYGPVIRDLSDVVAVRATLLAYAGGPIYVSGGVHWPDFMDPAAAGNIFDVYEGTTLIASGTVEIRTNNPARGIFRAVGQDRVNLVGDWRLIADLDGAGTLARPDMSWSYPDDNTAIQAWLAQWNTYALSIGLAQIPLSQTIDFKTQWNNQYTWTRMQADGDFSTPNRPSGFLTADSDHVSTKRARFYVENLVSGVCAQGRQTTAAAWITDNAAIPASPTAAEIELAKAAIQTVGIEIGDIDCGPNVFAPILSKKQRAHKVGRFTGEANGHRITAGQPHGGGYFSNEPDVYEETWGLHVDEIDMRNFDGGSVFKTKAVKNLTWGVIKLDQVLSAISIGSGTTGVGGDIIVRNQRLSTDEVNGGGVTCLVNIGNSPGFIIGGNVTVEQQDDQGDLRLFSIEYSPGFRLEKGFRFRGKRNSTAAIGKIVASDDCYLGFTDYEDSGAAGGPIWNVGDGGGGDADGGGSSNCVFDGFRTIGTSSLVKLVGKSANNTVRVRSREVEGFDPALALNNAGFGDGNVLEVIDQGLSAQTVVVPYAATDILQTAAQALLELDRFPVPAGSEADIGEPKNPTVGETVTVAGQVYTFRLAADLTVSFRVLTEGSGVDTGNAVQTLSNLKQAINDDGTEGVGGKYGTGTTPNPSVLADSVGVFLNLKAIVRGTAGNSIAIAKSAGLLATWSGSTLSGGGIYDAELMNRWRSYDTTSGSTDVTLPPLASTPVNVWVGFFKRVAANLLVIKDSTGATLFTLAAAGDAICLRRNTDGTAWSIVSAAPAWLATTLNASAGLMARTAAGTAASRTLTAPAAGLTITNPAGTAGNPTFALANDLAGLEGLGSSGIPARTATDTWAVRTMAAPAAGLTITNPGGVAGNPTFALANDLAAAEGLTGLGFVRRTATDTWTAQTIDTSNIITNSVFSYSPHTVGTLDDWDGGSASVVANNDASIPTLASATPISAFVCKKDSTSSVTDLVALRSQYFPCATGDVFYYEFWVCSTADATGTLQLGLRTLNAAATQGTGLISGTLISAPLSNWTKYSGYYTASTAQLLAVRPYFRTQSGGVGSWFITHVKLWRANIDTRDAQLGAANAFTGINTISGSNAALLRILDNSPGAASPWLEIIGDRNDANVSGAFSGQVALAHVRTDAEQGSGQVLGRLLFGGSTTPGDYDSADLRYSASVVGYADGAWPVGGATTPTGLRFYTGTTPQTPNAGNVDVGNVMALQLSSSGRATFVGAVNAAAGSASLPGVTVGGTDSGLSLVGSDVVISRGGVEKLRVGSTTLDFSNTSGNCQVRASSDAAISGFVASRFTADATGPQNILRKGRGTAASPAAPSSGDRLGQIEFLLSTTTPGTFVDGAQIRATVVAATPSATDAESRLALFASPSASVTLSEMLGIQHSTGLQMFGANTVINAARHPVLRSYTVATLPTASPAGQLIYVSDGTTNKRLAVSDATNWRWPDGAIVS
jgi:hypothetical protein